MSHVNITMTIIIFNDVYNDVYNDVFVRIGNASIFGETSAGGL